VTIKDYSAVLRRMTVSSALVIGRRLRVKVTPNNEETFKY